jgi:hypothetical protein
MPIKQVKEISEDIGGNVTVEYADDSTRKYNRADVATLALTATGEISGINSPLSGIAPIDIVLLQSAQPITLTGSTVQTVLARKTIPAGTLKANDALLIRYLSKQTNSANTKTIYVYFGSQAVNENGVTTLSTSNIETNIYVRGQTSQIGQNQFGGPSFGNGYAGSVPVLLNRDINTDITLDIRATLANATDSLTLEAFSFILRRGFGTNEA